MLRTNRGERRRLCDLISQQRQAYNFGMGLCLEAVENGKELPSKYDAWLLLTQSRQTNRMPAHVSLRNQRAGVWQGRDSAQKWYSTRSQYLNDVEYWTARLRWIECEIDVKPHLVSSKKLLKKHPDDPYIKEQVRSWQDKVKPVEAEAKRKRVKKRKRKPTQSEELDHCRAKLDKASQKLEKHVNKGTRRLFRSRKRSEQNPANLPALVFLECCVLLDGGFVRLPGGIKLRLMDKDWVVPEGHEWTGAVQIVDVTQRVTVKTRPEHRKFAIRPQMRLFCPELQEPSSRDEVIGVDAGVVITVAVSDGRMLNLPDEKEINAEIKAAQRHRSRCDYGSNQWNKRSKKIRRLSVYKTNVRDNTAKHIAKEVASTPGCKAVGGEITNTKGMSKSAKGTTDYPGMNVAQKRGLNRGLADKRFGGVRKLIERACAKQGVHYVGVSAVGTAQFCHKCGVKGIRETQSDFLCQNKDCGWEGNADLNGSCNVENRAWLFLADQQIRRLGRSSIDGCAEGKSAQQPLGEVTASITNKCEGVTTQHGYSRI